MFHYLQGEFYRTVRRRYLYVTFGACTALLLAVYLIFFFSNRSYGYDDQVHLDWLVKGLFPQIIPHMGLYATLLIGDMTFSEEHKVQTMRNTLFYGINRSTIFFGKFLNNLLFCVLLVLGLVGIVFALGVPLLGAGPDLGGAVKVLGEMMLTSMPLWIGGAALSTALYCCIPSPNMAAFTFVGIFLLPTNLLHLTGFVTQKSFFYDFRAILPSSRLSQITEMAFLDNPSFTGLCWITGIVFAALVLAIGFILFRRKEIK